MRLPSNALVLVGPAILLVFAACFLVVWMVDRKKQYIFCFFAGSALFCLGSLSQMLWIPSGSAPNATTSAFIYTLSILLICDGLLKRNHQKISIGGYVVILGSVVGSIAYFSFINTNLAIRIYILNFGFGAIFLYLLWKIRNIRVGLIAEKILFWVLLVFSLQFFIRTIITMESLPLTPTEFGLSLFWYALQFSLAVFGVAFALSLLAVVVSDKYKDLEQDRLIDPLTGLLNRRGMVEKLDSSYRKTSPVISAMIIDIDYFKSINDAYGHGSGDKVIAAIANVIVTSTSGYESICCRIGGEEYAVLLPQMNLEVAVQLADSIRKNISELNFFYAEDTKSITVSIGVSTSYSDFVLEDLMSEADAALYKAKRSGRNCVKPFNHDRRLNKIGLLSCQQI